MIRTSVNLGTALLLLIGWLAASAAWSAAPPCIDGQIALWVRTLDDDRFAVRELAQVRLLKAGKPAIPALTGAASSPSLEVATRVFRILEKLATSADRSTADETRRALVKLAASDHVRAAASARSVLQALLGRIVADLQKGGAGVTVQDGKIVKVNLDAAPRLALLVPLLRNLPDLESLSAGTKQMDDAVLARLKSAPRLQKLNLYQSNLGDEGLKHLKNFPSLRSVPMGESKVTDAGLKHLADLTELEYVGLRANRVTDAGLVHLRKLTNLTGLCLSETRVTDAGLKHLADMKKMEYLRLDNLAVTDAGLSHLAGMTNLRRLDLWRTRVTQTGVNRLRKTLPKLIVVLQER